MPGGKWARLWDNLWKHLVAPLFATWVICHHATPYRVDGVHLSRRGQDVCGSIRSVTRVSPWDLLHSGCSCRSSGGSQAVSAWLLLWFQALGWIYLGEGGYTCMPASLDGDPPLKGSWGLSPAVACPAEGMLLGSTLMWQGNHGEACIHGGPLAGHSWFTCHTEVGEGFCWLTGELPNAWLYSLCFANVPSAVMALSVFLYPPFPPLDHF